ncbi:MAG: hypothetical protein ACRD0P_38400, partial [Stackebrandtia sp.]
MALERDWDRHWRHYAGPGNTNPADALRRRGAPLCAGIESDYVPSYPSPVLVGVRRLARDHWPLLIVLALGLLIRVAMMVASSPAILSYPDTWGYVKGAAEELFVP